jgi:hypothetical protein
LPLTSSPHSARPRCAQTATCGAKPRLPGAVARGAPLAAAVDLEHGRVRVDRDRLAGVAAERAVQPLAGARQAALDGLAQTASEALGQLQRGRRRRHPGDRAKLRAGRVGAQLLDVVKALAADQLRLRQRHHQLAARDAAAAALDRRGATLGGQLAVEQLDQPRAARQLAGAGQPRERRQRVVVGAKDDPSGAPVTVNDRHRLGDLHSHPVAGFDTPPPSRINRTENPATAGFSDSGPTHATSREAARTRPATHGFRSDTGPAPQSIPFASRVRCLVALGACRRTTALRPS